MGDAARRARLNPLWRKAPLALARHRTAFLAVVCGALLVALAAASLPLFATATGSAALKRSLAEVGPFLAGMEVMEKNKFPPPATAPPSEERDRTLRQSFAGVRFVGPGVPSVLSGRLAARSEGSGRGPVVSARLLARPGALEHVERLAGGAGSGVWIAASVARALRLRPGDELELGKQIGLAFAGDVLQLGRERADARVAGIYRDLWQEPETAYWANFYDEIQGPQGAGFSGAHAGYLPPAFVIGARAEVLRLYRAVGGGGLERRWEFPVESRGITLAAGKRLERRFAAFEHELADPRESLGNRAGCYAPAFVCKTRSSLDAAVVAAEREAGAVSPPARLLGWAGTLVALAAVAAAGAFLVARRRTEARLLFARGESAGSFALRTALEAVLPAAAGGLVGFGLAYLLTGLYEPEATVDGGGLWRAGTAALAGVGAGLALLAVVAGVAFLRAFGTGLHRPRRLGWVLWELALLALAGYLAWRLRSGGALVGGVGPDVAHLSLAVFLFPLVLVAGVAGLLARACRLQLRVLGARAARLPVPLFLALRRLAAARGLLVLLVVACAVALGGVLYAQALTGSLERTVQAKAHVAVGGDVAGTIAFAQPLPRRFPFPVTKVSIAYAGAALGSSIGRQVDLMAVDPKTLPAVAFWEPSWGPPLATLARRLEDTSGGRLPVIVAGGAAGTSRLAVEGTLLPMRIVATVSGFPGMSATHLLVVTSYDALARLLARAGVSNPLGEPSATTNVWARGPAPAVIRALRASALRPYDLQTTAGFLRDPDVTAASRTFAMLRAIGIAVGLLALLGLLLYLGARQRGRIVASALSSRMGLPARAQALSVALELALLLLLAAASAAAGALTAARLVVERLDPLSQFPPKPIYEAPLLATAITVCALAAAAVLGGWLASRAARRADLADALRLGE